MTNKNALAGIFDDDRDAIAAKLEHEGRVYYLRFWAPETRDAEKRFARETAEKMGITVEQYGDKDFKRSIEQAEINETALEALHNAIVCDVLLGVGLPGEEAESMKKIAPERATRLMPGIKKTLADYAVSNFRYGVGEAQFFRLRNGGNVSGE